MKRRLPSLLTGALLVGLIWFLWPRREEEPDPPPPPAAPTSPPGSRLPPSAPEPRSTLADALHAPGRDGPADLRVVLDLLDAFRTNFSRVGNPTGTNAEITAALSGRNPLRLALLPPDHPAINAAGELCDRWGTPFFFHAESATRMEVRSAGPDRKLWTADDLVLAP